MDCSPPGSYVHEILQATILEWAAISFSMGSSQPRDRTQVSCTAGRFFTDWATRKAQVGQNWVTNTFSFGITVHLGFPGGSDGKESACSVGDLGSIPGLGRSLGGQYGNPLQCSCLENPHGQRSLAGPSPWGCKGSDKTEQLSTAQHSFGQLMSYLQAPISLLMRRGFQHSFKDPERIIWDHVNKHTVVSSILVVQWTKLLLLDELPHLDFKNEDHFKAAPLTIQTGMRDAHSYAASTEVQAKVLVAQSHLTLQLHGV